MASSKIAVTEGSGKNVATYSISEDAVTKEISRVVIGDSSGTELSLLTQSDFDSKTGSLTETAPASDTASSGLNGRLQRVAQRVTSLIALLPSALTGSGNLKCAVVESTATQTVSGSVSATQSGTWNVTNVSGTVSLPTGAATETTLSSLNGKVTACNTGAVTISAAIPAGTNNIGVVTPYSAPASLVDGTATSTGTGDTQVIAAQGAGVVTYVTSIIVHNSSATDSFVTIKDGSTAKLVYPAPQKSGAVHSLVTPLKLTSNTALNFASGAGVTTMYVSALGYKI